MSKENTDIFDFEKLVVYKKSLEFIDYTYTVIEGNFPQSEIYNLSSQLKRAACSISLNIGEGSGGSRKEFIQFLTISKRSLRECVVCTSIALRRKYITEEINTTLRSQLTEISKMISGLINYLESDKAKNTLHEPVVEYGTVNFSEPPTLNSEL